MEVVDSTETYYVLKYESIKSASKDSAKTSVDSLINEKVKLLAKDIPILIRTDHLGAFEDFHNWPEMKEAIDKMVEWLSDDFWDVMPDHLKNGIYKNKEAFIANVFAPLLTKEFFLASFRNVIQLFHYHGGQYGLDDIYNYTEQRLSSWDGTMIDTNGELWVEDIDEENSYAFMCNSTTFNSDQAIASYVNYLTKVTGSDNAPNLTEIPYVFTSEDRNAFIHTDSGWTTNTYFEVRTEIKKIVHMQTIEVNMLFDDEDEDGVKQ